MRLFGNPLGKASEINTGWLENEVAALLISGESIERAYQLFRDLIVFTSERLIKTDKRGLMGKKVEFVSIPYGSVTKFSKESAGCFNVDAEIRV